MATTAAPETAAPATNATPQSRNAISLWVGDLAPEVTERELYQVFSAVRTCLPCPRPLHWPD